MPPEKELRNPLNRSIIFVNVSQAWLIKVLPSLINNYSPKAKRICTEPEANNCISIITQGISI